ncbi:hypothetical protein, partial [Salmonella enterica]|uniref:hypothetical protein n=1 Tax=Salmonella enterica TaxID=28901 RepID=UPI003296BC6F
MGILRCIAENSGTADCRPSFLLRFFGDITPQKEGNMFKRCFSPLALVNQLRLVVMLSTAIG